MNREDGEKIERGALRFLDVLQTHGELVHDAIAEHMGQWLIEHGFEASLEVMAHVAGNVSEEQWATVVAKAAAQLKAVGDA